MTEEDRLVGIERRWEPQWADGMYLSTSSVSPGPILMVTMADAVWDVPWLIAEVKRLRALVKE